MGNAVADAPISWRIEIGVEHAAVLRPLQLGADTLFHLEARLSEPRYQVVGSKADHGRAAGPLARWPGYRRRLLHTRRAGGQDEGKGKER